MIRRIIFSLASYLNNYATKINVKHLFPCVSNFRAILETGFRAHDIFAPSSSHNYYLASI